VLVETHDDAELERALALDAHVVGVNARNLGTFAEDLSVGERQRAVSSSCWAAADTAGVVRRRSRPLLSTSGPRKMPARLKVTPSVR